MGAQMCAGHINLGDGGNPASLPSQAYATSSNGTRKSGLADWTMKLHDNTHPGLYSKALKTAALGPIRLLPAL